jgi:hypothetical protein
LFFEVQGYDIDDHEVAHTAFYIRIEERGGKTEGEKVRKSEGKKVRKEETPVKSALVKQKK